MAWGGDGNTGFLSSNLPKGWILCNGTIHPASRYPLLASIIADTYGGTNFSGTFPDYSGSFKVPDLTAKCPMDLEPDMLVDSAYQYGQTDAASVLGTKVLDFGTTTPIPTLISADSNINFTVNSTLVFTGKMTNITITNPDFGATIYTMNRKLGINHTPGHNHPGTYSKAAVDANGPMLFESARITTSGSVTSDICSRLKATFIECQLSDAAKAPSWQNGSAEMTYYGDETREYTLVTTDVFHEFQSTPTQDWGNVPANVWPTSLNNDFSENGFTRSFSDPPVRTHQQPAWTGFFPRPSRNFARRNYFGYTASNTPVGPTQLADDPEIAPTAEVPNVTIAGSATKFSLPSGTLVGTNIVPNMWVKGINIAPGTQVLSINRVSGTSAANYVYEIELSNTTINATTVTGQTVIFLHGTFPTTLNNADAGQDPNNRTFTGHSHTSFEIAMSIGSLTGPATHPVAEGNGFGGGISIGDVAPENIADALNIIADITAPSLNVTFIIKAY